MADKPKIFFLCTGNSCRSQMAEAWTRRLQGEQFEAYSAGVSPKAVDPRAITAMAEAGLDITGQKSKDVDALGNLEFDYVVTLCDNARESCPYFPAKTRLIHRGFDDPPKLAEGMMIAFLLIFYGVFRFFLEFFREPDVQPGILLGPFTMGQSLSAAMVGAGLVVPLLIRFRRRTT